MCYLFGDEHVNGLNFLGKVEHHKIFGLLRFFYIKYLFFLQRRLSVKFFQIVPFGVFQISLLLNYVDVQRRGYPLFGVQLMDSFGALILVDMQVILYVSHFHVLSCCLVLGEYLFSFSL